MKLQKNRSVFRLLAFCILVFATTPLLAAETVDRAAPKPVIPTPPPPIPEFLMSTIPPIEKIEPGIFKMGDILINKYERSITFPALINQKDGLLEYILVHSRGKVHESLLRTNVEPYYLNLAFLLLEFEATDKPLQFQGDPALPKGTPVSIAISHKSGNNPATIATPGTMIVLKKYNDHSSVQDPGEIDWVYTGARIWNGRFSAQTTGSIVAIYHDPDAIIDNASPGGESDKIWFVKEGTVPPVGSPVSVVIKAKK